MRDGAGAVQSPWAAPRHKILRVGDEKGEAEIRLDRGDPRKPGQRGCGEVRILALDLSSSTGWACGSDGGTPISHGIIRMPKTGDDIGCFLRVYRDWLAAAIEELEPTEIVFESPILRGENGIAALRKLYSLAGVTELVSLDHKVPVTEANLSQIRVHFIGTCRAPSDIKKKEKRRKWLKAKVVGKCRELGFKVAGDDDADAIALLDYILSLRNPKHALRATPLFREQAA